MGTKACSRASMKPSAALRSVLPQVVLDRLVDIPVGQLTRDDGLGFHPRAREQLAL